MAKNESGSVATQMAAATANATIAHASPLPNAPLRFRLEAKPSEYTGAKKNAPTYKRVGFALASIGGHMGIPLTVSVVFPSDGAKPVVEARFVASRYPQLDGIEVEPNITKAQQAEAEATTKAFRRRVATEFRAWYLQQPDVPELTSRVTGTDTAAGIDA